ncbi:unnamed protein product, partial [Pylaiella littoralis]
PDACPARDAGRNDSGKAWRQGCSHQHRKQGEGTLHALSCCHGERQQGSTTDYLQGHAVHPSDQVREGQEHSAAEGVDRGRDC